VAAGASSPLRQRLRGNLPPGTFHEIPTPRWTAYDCVRFGIKMSPEVPMEQQERVWTSPIWYTP
jgi:hypothetical protein